MEILFAFNTTSAAILAEQTLLSSGLPVKVMPLPSKIKAGCGICLRLPPQHVQKAVQLLARHPVAEYQLYARTRVAGGSHYTPYTL